LLLRGGVEVWNQWRKEHPRAYPDLSGADLHGIHLMQADFLEVDLSGADLSGAYVSEAVFYHTNLERANLRGTDFTGADLTDAYLIEADLTGADLSMARLADTDLTRADLTGADLYEAVCVKTNFSGATLTSCNVYGVSTWDVNLVGAVQADLRIIPGGKESLITVDNLEVAQFLYLLLHNEKMRAVLDTITSKVVLILGRFSEERKPILDALREALRKHPNGYIPVLFDFEPQADKPVLETVKTLANLARFIVADLTDPHMVRAELTAIVPNVPTVPIQPTIEGNANLPTEYESWTLYKSFLPVYRYTDLSHLLASLTDAVLMPVEAHVQARHL
jgi:hypothetical protein